MQPALSIITVTFRDPDGLQKTIESLIPLLDSDLAWEHLVVDSSPEISRPILDRLRDGYPLEHVPQEPRGIYSAMNLGIRTARGAILWFLNGGDVLSDRAALESMLGLFSGEPRLGLVCGTAEVVRGGRMILRLVPEVSLYHSTLGLMSVNQQATLYASWVFERFGGYCEDYRIGADYEHLLRCLAASVEARMTDACLTTFDGSGTAATNVWLAVAETRLAYRRHRGDFDWVTNLRHEVHWLMWVVRTAVSSLLRRTPIYSSARKLWLAWRSWVSRPAPAVVRETSAPAPSRDSEPGS